MTILPCSLLQEVAPCWCGCLPQRAGICGVVCFSAVSQQTHWICHRHPSEKVSTLSCFPVLVNSSATALIDNPSQLSVEFFMDEDNNLTMNDFAYYAILGYGVTSCRQLNRIQIIFLSLADCTLQKQCNSNCFFSFFESNRWIPEVQQICCLGSKRKLIPSNSSVARLQSFYNCLATLMSFQLQSLALESIQDYTHLIAQDPVRSVPL